MTSKQILKWHYVVFGKYSKSEFTINEVLIQTQKYVVVVFFT